MKYTELAPSAQSRALIAKLLNSSLLVNDASWEFMDSSYSSSPGYHCAVTVKSSVITIRPLMLSEINVVTAKLVSVLWQMYSFNSTRGN